MAKVFKILSASTVIVGLISGVVFGQQVYTSGVRVGITGIATPNIEMINNDNPSKYLRMWSWSGPGNWGNYLIQGGDQAIMYTDALVIGKFPASGTTNTQGLRIDGNGNVGIGEGGPAQKLHVKTGGANSLQYGMQIQNPNSTDAGGTATGILFSCETPGNFGKGGIVYERTAPWGMGSIHFLQNTAWDNSNAALENAVMTIANNGNLGIGERVPAQKFHVKTPGGNNLQYALELQNPNGKDAGGTATGMLFSCEPLGKFGKGAIVYERTGQWGMGSIHFLQNTAYNNSNASLENAVMTIANNGNVGIGIKPSANKLSVNGNTAINGTLRAQELIAEATLTVWPDYVFNKGYKAVSLSQTESYIAQNGHLPGIPSQAEVTKNGVNVVDLQAKMLKTIEEITLQMIALKKENDQLKQRMDQLAKR